MHRAKIEAGIETGIGTKFGTRVGARVAGVVRWVCLGLLVAGLVGDAIHEALNHRSATVQLGVAWLVLNSARERVVRVVLTNKERPTGERTN